MWVWLRQHLTARTQDNPDNADTEHAHYALLDNLLASENHELLAILPPE